MRALVIAVLLAACGGKPDPQPPKRPNNELIVGEFERRHQEAHTAARFKADGSITIASKADELDSKAIATGTYKLDGEKLTLVYTKGDLCEAGVEGTYNVVISKVGIRFTKLDDACERRAKIDGETWYRR